MCSEIRWRAALGTLLVCGGLACRSTQPAAEAVHLAVRESPEIGRYVSDAGGRPLYAPETSAGAPSCDVRCTETWPPVPGVDPPLESAEPAIQQALVGSIVRANGDRQLTYAGLPLHYRRADEGELQRSVKDTWGTWSLVFPHGERMVP